MSAALPTRSAVARPGPPTAAVGERDWVAALASEGPERDQALADLHGLMVRAARHQVHRMRGLVGDRDARSLDDIAAGAADVALTALLAKLSSFQGRSRFTTWAYKFAILEAATQVRRERWSGRDVVFDTPDVRDSAPGPAERAEARDLAGALARALQTVLTPHQRRIATAILIDEVPIDVLADRLGTTRGALYKTLHDARVRLREHLITTGHLPDPAAGATP